MLQKCIDKHTMTCNILKVFSYSILSFLYAVPHFCLSADLQEVKMRAPSSPSVELGWPKWGGCGLGKEPRCCWGTSWSCWVSLLYWTVNCKKLHQVMCWTLKTLWHGSRIKTFYHVSAWRLISWWDLTSGGSWFKFYVQPWLQDTCWQLKGREKVGILVRYKNKKTNSFYCTECFFSHVY